MNDISNSERLHIDEILIFKSSQRSQYELIYLRFDSKHRDNFLIVVLLNVATEQSQESTLSKIS